ncbi:hypothetical protein ABRY23_03265 [Melioribacteraceae bacterium 4301-Me]|uniref:hypothetical protein n=1 Tax=Pyranulibacter aquaticus TaxID=3163344 RepID=UPI003597014F
MDENKIISRKKFLISLVIGSLTTLLLSFLPIKIFSKKSNPLMKNKTSKIKINIHPNAVMRNKKV